MFKFKLTFNIELMLFVYYSELFKVTKRSWSENKKL